MSDVVRPWRGVSADDRRAGRGEQLREACLDIVGERGVAGTTVDLVCATAGLSKRYFYESFTSLDNLLVTVVDDRLVSMLSAMKASLEQLDAGVTGPERIHVIVTILIDELSEDPRFARLYVECPGHPLLRARRDDAITQFTAFLVDDVLEGPRSPHHTARRLLTVRVVVAGTTDLVTGWLRGDIEADRETIIATIEFLGRAA